MIYSDGAGACIIEDSEDSGEILAHTSATYTNEEAYYLFFGESFNKSCTSKTQYIKMYGRKIYEFALIHVPNAMRELFGKKRNTH